MSSSVIEVPLSKLVASQANVRRTGVNDGLSELAASIAAHGLLQPLLVAAREDGRYEVVAGGRRLAALKVLAKVKTIPRGFLIPVLVREVGEEQSLAENMVRMSLHPADQYEAFRRLEVGGLGSADIAARFGVSQRVVRQRLALGAVSPALMQAYRDGELTLAQLEAFTVTDDHDRQEQAFQALGVYRDPHRIRGLLTQAHVSGRDRRVVFLELDSYEAAGGVVLRDLFSATEDVWLTDIGLLDRLCLGKLGEIAGQLRGESWLWAIAALDFPHGHGYRRLYPKPVEVAPEIGARRQAANLELEALYRGHPSDDVPEDVAQQMAELDAEITRLSAEAYAFDADEIARSGVFVVIGHEGDARIERGFVRPEDERASEPEDDNACSIAADADTADTVSGDIADVGGEPGEDDSSEDEGGGLALSDRLMADLSAHRTAALRDALARTPDIAMLALAHSMILQGFYGARHDMTSCLTIRIDSPALGHHVAGIEDDPAGRAITERHAEWAQTMPAEPASLWSG